MLALDANAPSTSTTPTLDGAEAAVGLDLDGSGGCAAEGHGKAERGFRVPVSGFRSLTSIPPWRAK